MLHDAALTEDWSSTYNHWTALKPFAIPKLNSVFGCMFFLFASTELQKCLELAHISFPGGISRHDIHVPTMYR